MSEATFTFRVDEALKSEFAQAAKARDRTGAQLLRDFMRDFVRQQEEAAEHDEADRPGGEAMFHGVCSTSRLTDFNIHSCYIRAENIAMRPCVSHGAGHSRDIVAMD